MFTLVHTDSHYGFSILMHAYIYVCCSWLASCRHAFHASYFGISLIAGARCCSFDSTVLTHCCNGWRALHTNTFTHPALRHRPRPLPPPTTWNCMACRNVFVGSPARMLCCQSNLFEYYFKLLLGRIYELFYLHNFLKDKL